MDEKNNQPEYPDWRHEQPSDKESILDEEKAAYRAYIDLIHNALMRAGKMQKGDKQRKILTRPFNDFVVAPDGKRSYQDMFLSSSPASFRRMWLRGKEIEQAITKPSVFIRTFAVKHILDDSGSQDMESSDDIAGYYVHVGAGRETYALFFRTRDRDLMKRVHDGVSKDCLVKSQPPHDYAVSLYNNYSGLKSPDFKDEQLVSWRGKVLNPFPNGMFHDEQIIAGKLFEVTAGAKTESAGIPKIELIPGDNGMDTKGNESYSKKFHKERISDILQEEDGKLKGARSVRMRGFVSGGKRSGDVSGFIDHIISRLFSENIIVNTKAVPYIDESFLSGPMQLTELIHKSEYMNDQKDVVAYVVDIFMNKKNIARLLFYTNNKDTAADMHSDLIWRFTNPVGEDTTLKDFMYTWNSTIDDTENRVFLDKNKKLVERIF